MRISVDRDRCIGTGICESIAPDVFEVGDDGVMRLLTDGPEDTAGTVAESDRERMEQAVARCPTGALKIIP